MALTTYGDISPATAAWSSVEMLRRGQPNLIIQQFLQSKPLPKNQTKTINFRRYERLSAATTALTEGVTPTGSTPTKTDYTATLSQYGDFLELTDVIADTHTDPILQEYSGMLGEQAALTIDTLAFNILKAGTNLLYANGSARTDVNTPLTLNLQRKAVRSLKRQYAEKITTKLSSSASFNTESVKPGYIGLVHPDMTFVVRELPGFKDVVDYGSGADMYMGEIGAVEEVRYIDSTVFSAWADGGGAKAGSGTTMISTTGTAADVYPVLYMARDCAAAVALKGAGAMIPGVLNPGVMREGDPLGQRGYVSWKTYYTAVILNQAWMVRCEVSIPEL